MHMDERTDKSPSFHWNMQKKPSQSSLCCIFNLDAIGSRTTSIYLVPYSNEKQNKPQNQRLLLFTVCKKANIH